MATYDHTQKEELAAIYDLETSIQRTEQDLRAMNDMLSAMKAQRDNLRAKLNNAYQGSSTWTHEQRQAARRGILEALQDKGKTIGELLNDLPHLDESLIEAEKRYLMKHGAVKYNGGRGTNAKYYRG